MQEVLTLRIERGLRSDLFWCLCGMPHPNAQHLETSASNKGGGGRHRARLLLV